MKSKTHQTLEEWRLISTILETYYQLDVTIKAYFTAINRTKFIILQSILFLEFDDVPLCLK